MKPDQKSAAALCAFAASNELVAAIDRAADVELLSRSAWARRAVARELARGGFLPADKTSDANGQPGARA